MEFICSIIVCLYISLLSTYILLKAINYKWKDISKKKISILICSYTVFAIIYSIINNYLNFFATILMLCIFLNLIFAYLTKYKLEHSIYITLFSISIAYICYTVSALVSSSILYLILQNESETSTLLALQLILSTAIVYFLFKIRKFENRIFFF